MANETGESTASINRRADDAAWPEIEKQLRAGELLTKPPRLKDYFTSKSGRRLSQARVYKLEKEGVLELIGVHIYAIRPRRGGDQSPDR